MLCFIGNIFSKSILFFFILKASYISKLVCLLKTEETYLDGDRTVVY